MRNRLLERSIADIYSGQRWRQTFKTSYVMEIHILLYRKRTLINRNENEYRNTHKKEINKRQKRTHKLGKGKENKQPNILRGQ